MIVTQGESGGNQLGNPPVCPQTAAHPLISVLSLIGFKPRNLQPHPNREVSGRHDKEEILGGGCY